MLLHNRFLAREYLLCDFYWCAKLPKTAKYEVNNFKNYERGQNKPGRTANGRGLKIFLCSGNRGN